MSLKLGDRFVPFSLPGVDGAEHGPRDGRITAIVFWCNHCPYVQAWEDRLVALARDASDVDVIAVGANDTARQPQDGFEQMRERAHAHGYPFPYVRDEAQGVARAYGGERTPDVFLFAADGRLAYRGAIDDAWEHEKATVPYLAQAIASLRDGRAPSPAETARVGCTIKWRA